MICSTELTSASCDSANLFSSTVIRFAAAAKVVSLFGFNFTDFEMPAVYRECGECIFASMLAKRVPARETHSIECPLMLTKSSSTVGWQREKLPTVVNAFFRVRMTVIALLGIHLTRCLVLSFSPSLLRSWWRTNESSVAP